MIAPSGAFSAPPRLSSDLWVGACVFRASRAGMALVVTRKGDARSGAILIKLCGQRLGCSVLVEGRDAGGGRAWYRGTGPAPVEEATADAYIARSLARDPDIWVIEIETDETRLPFDEPVLSL